MLRRHIVLLIAIRPSDGDVKPGGPLGAFREEQAMSRHRVSTSPFLSSSSHTTHNYTTQTVTHTVTLTSTSYNTVQILFPGREQVNTKFSKKLNLESGSGLGTYWEEKMTTLQEWHLIGTPMDWVGIEEGRRQHVVTWLDTKPNRQEKVGTKLKPWQAIEYDGVLLSGPYASQLE